MHRLAHALKSAGFVFTLALMSCGAPESEAPAELDTSEAPYHIYGYEKALDEKVGEGVFNDVCATCHDGGDLRAPHTAMIRLMSAESILKALNQGAMQAQAEGLSQDEKTRVAEYLADHRMGDQAAAPEPLMCEAGTADFDMSQPPAWPGWGLTRGNTHYIDPSKTSLTRDNVKSLKLKWSFVFPEALRVRSQPAFAGGSLIVGSHNGKVYSLDPETACVRWIFEASADVRNGIVVSPWEPSDENAQPLAYFGDLIGNIYAVDARNGALVWRDRPDMHPNATITGAPTLYGDTLFVPVSSLEVTAATKPDYECCTFRGSVVAYDPKSGEKKWQTYTIPEAPAPVGVNSIGATRFAPSGAPVWNSPAVDEARGQILFGTGENYTSPAGGTSDAIIAVDMQTGKVNWVYQATAGDAWNSACSVKVKGPNCPEEDGPDVDFGAGATIATTPSGRDLVIAGQKSGDIHALDPDTGALAWKTKAGRGSLNGGVHFGIASGGGRVYVPIADVLDITDFPGERHPGMHALNMETGEFIWRTPMADRCHGRDFCVPGHSGAISVTDELVLAGALDGWVIIYDAETGEVLWEYDTAKPFTDAAGNTGNGGAISGGAAPIAYGNMVFVSSGYAFNGMMPGNVLLAFEVE